MKVIDPETGESRWKHVEKAAGRSKRQAESMLRDRHVPAEDGRYVPTSMTVLELGRKWLREHVQPNLKPSAAANYTGTFYLHVVPTLGAVRLEDCKAPIVKALLGRKRAEGLSEQTVAKIRRHLHAMFAFAQDAGLVSINPASAPRARSPRQRRRARGVALTPEQIAAFLCECSRGRDGKTRSNARWRLFFTVALDTGLRRGELVGLRWEDVDLASRVIHVRRSIGNYDDRSRWGSRTAMTS